MITESGRVVARDRDHVWVRSIRQSACDSCQVRHGCGQKALAALSAGRANQVRVGNHLDAAVGDTVVLEIAEATLLRASLLVYALPLALMLAGVVGAARLVPGSEAAAMAMATLGLVLGFVLAARGSRRQRARFAPTLARIESRPLDDVVSLNPTNM